MTIMHCELEDHRGRRRCGLCQGLSADSEGGCDAAMPTEGQAIGRGKASERLRSGEDGRGGGGHGG
jgi:hypothetical protein